MSPARQIRRAAAPRQRLLWGLLGGATLGLAVASGWAWQGRIAPQTHDAYVHELREAARLDALLDEQVAAAHMGHVAHYDDLVRTWDALVDNRARLAEAPDHVDGASALALADALASLEATRDRKGRLLERFKTEEAVLRTARRTLPHAIERLGDAVEGTPAEAVLATALVDLLLHAASRETARVGPARCALAVLRAGRAAASPPGSLSSPGGAADCAVPAASEAALAAVAPALRAAVVGHGEVFLVRQPVVREVVRELMDLPVQSGVAQVAVAYDQAHGAARDREAARTRLVEALAGLVMLLGAAVVVSRLHEDAAALRVTTGALTEAMGALRQERDRETEVARLKSRFVSMTSHEFRTPLSVILSSAQLLQAYGERWPVERRDKHLHRIEQAGRAMSRMVDRLLLIGRADADLLELHTVPVDLGALLDEVAAEVKAQAGAGRVLLREGEPPRQPVCLDGKLLRHVLTNLVGNAFKYSDLEDPVVLAIDRDGDALVFEVRDQGIGIPVEDLALLFEPFHRAGNAGRIPGTGLGLAIVQRAVRAHGGEVTVASTVGGGSTFRVHLPGVLPPEAAVPRSQETP